MTCEVVVLNRLGLSLAADSAVTFRSQSAGDNSTTYSSGANKIFQLTEVEPVGLMVYNNATLQGVPWELLIKSFRTKFGAGCCNRLADYKAEIALYLEQHTELFPSSFRDVQTKALLARAALLFIEEVRKTKPLLFDAATAQATDWAECLHDFTNQIAAVPLHSLFTPADIAATKQKFGAWISQEISDHISNAPHLNHLADFFSAPVVGQLVIEGAYKFFIEVFGADYTGVVLAGFGKEDFFPAFCEMKFYGFLGNTLVWHEESAQSVSHDSASAIEAFARQSMVETFLTGAAPSIWGNARTSFKTFASQACQDVLSKAGTTLPAPDLAASVEHALNNFSQTWQQNAISTHYAPLRNVVASLTIEELAELAETLVMLESLKEKVTSRTQSVGGPVDVAVITKAEGLVWIKRKLYFSPELNHRYFARHK